VPADAVAAADVLQAGLQAASPSPAFSDARVLAAGGRLVVLPGTPVSVSFHAAPNDTAADDLGLTGAARQVLAVVGSPLSLPLRSAAPSVDVLVGNDPAVTVAVAGAGSPTSVADAASSLEGAAQHVDADAVVAVLDDRLVLLSTRPMALTESAGDRTTVSDLGLALQAPAISADRFGRSGGPSAIVERSTIIGPTAVRQLDHVSDVIFTAPVWSQRVDVGCVRFSYVPSRSRTPRRFHCLPDDAAPIPVPEFTSLHYGQAAYGQLSDACPEAIRRGGHDESEIGAFFDLHEPQRQDNLALRLDEYLRLSRDAGTFHAT
jgi:hypothetical protein